MADDSQQTDTKTEAIEFISFLDMLPAAVELDKSVAIAELSYQSSLETAKAAWSGWYPKADITLNSGEQYDVKPGGSNGGVTSPGMTGANGTGSSNQRYNPTEAKLKITQKLWDFGETSADIETSKLTAEMSRLSLHGAKNQTILKAAQAYIGLKKAHAQFKIAQDGEMQLKKQTGLQDLESAEVLRLALMFYRRKCISWGYNQQGYRGGGFKAGVVTIRKSVWLHSTKYRRSITNTHSQQPYSGKRRQFPRGCYEKWRPTHESQSYL